jgi:hypothetical protein
MSESVEGHVFQPCPSAGPFKGPAKVLELGLALLFAKKPSLHFLEIAVRRQAFGDHQATRMRVQPQIRFESVSGILSGCAGLLSARGTPSMYWRLFHLSRVGLDHHRPRDRQYFNVFLKNSRKASVDLLNRSVRSTEEAPLSRKDRPAEK